MAKIIPQAEQKIGFLGNLNSIRQEPTHQSWSKTSGQEKHSSFLKWKFFRFQLRKHRALLSKRSRISPGLPNHFWHAPQWQMHQALELF